MSTGTTIRELVARLGLEVDEKSFARGAEAIQGLSLGFKAFAVAAGAAVAGALVHFTRETAEAADAAGKLAQSTGLNSQFLQKLGYAAELADVSTQQLAVGLRHLAKTGVKDVQGEVLRLADQFKTMPNDGARVALAMEKFGKSGAALIPMLKDGAEGISELMQEAEDLGLIFSEEDSKAAEEFNDDLTRLGKSLTGLRNDIGRALLPVLHKLVNGMRGFMKELRAVLPTVKTFATVIKTVAVVALAALTASLLSNAAAVLANIGWYTALSIASIRAAVSAAYAWVAAAAPMAALVALLAIALLIAEDFYGYLHGKKSVIGQLHDEFESFLQDFVRPREEPWFLKQLRFAVAMLTGFKAEAPTATRDDLAAMGAATAGGRAAYEADAARYGSAAISYDQLMEAQRQIQAQPGPVSARVTINSPVTINGAGGSPKDIAEEIGRVWEEQTAKAHRVAQGGIP